MADISSSADGSERSEAQPCFIVEDNPAVARFIAAALLLFGVRSEHMLSVPALVARLQGPLPQVIFLDISLDDSDAIDAIRALTAAGFGGTIQLMSGSNTGLLADVRQVGERHGFHMRPTLTKPFHIAAIRQVVEEEGLGFGTAAAPVVGAEQAVEHLAIPRGPTIDLREALDKNWLELWYQPKFDLRSGNMVGAEGLARIRHPEHGLISPASFIPGASGADLIALADYALHTALRDASDLVFAGHYLRLAINVPVEALLSLPISSIVRDGRPRASEWPGIILEVTEDQVIHNIEAAHEIATQLRIYNVALAIDDFGRGYSSLMRLTELPFAELKLDQSFVQDCSTDPTRAGLCQTVVEMAHRFGASAVAEGIEQAGDLRVIRRISCDIGQGFLFAHPAPMEVLLTQLLAGDDGGFAMVHGQTRSDRKTHASA